MSQDADNEEPSLDRAKADLELLLSAYPDEIVAEGEVAFTLRLGHPSQRYGQQQQSGGTMTITMELPPGYPKHNSLCVRSYRGGTGSNKLNVEKTVEAVRNEALVCLEYGEEAGLRCCLVAQSTWAECLELEAQNEQAQLEVEEAERRQRARRKEEDGYGIEWVSGVPLTDRKSTFQAHVAVVADEDMVRRALRKLINENSKIERASHNMYAYRFTEVTRDGKKILKHDNDDDGEDGAGSRLAQLLAMRNEDGVLVVVSRWFGGIHLGPKRFGHIVNVARDILVDCHNSDFLQSAS